MVNTLQLQLRPEQRLDARISGARRDPRIPDQRRAGVQALPTHSLQHNGGGGSVGRYDRQMAHLSLHGRGEQGGRVKSAV